MMGALIGSPGGLERLKGSSRLVITKAQRYTFSETLGGVRRAYRGPAPRRVWEAQVATAKPEQWHMLAQLEAGLIPGPVVWYDEMSQVTNILPPDVSMCDGPEWPGGEQAGARSQAVTSDGARFLRSIQGESNGWVEMPMLVPVPHGQQIVVSVYLTGHGATPAQLVVDEFDPEGRIIETRQQETTSEVALERLTIDFTTSQRATALQVRARNVLTLALPAITFTQNPVPWANGRGCLNAVVELHDEDVQTAFETPTDWGRRSSYSFTITELG